MSIYSWPVKCGKKRYYFQFMRNGQWIRGQGGFDTYSETLKAEGAARNQIVYPQRTTFEILCNLYIDSIKSKQSLEWVVEKEHFFKNHFSNWLSFQCKNITSKMIETHMEKRAIKVSNGTANKDLKMLKTLFNFAIKQEIVLKNPCDKVTLFPEEERVRYIPSLQDFLSVLKVAKPIDQAFMKVVFLTAGRVGEIYKLKWCDVFEDHLILWSRKHKGGELKFRKIPLSPILKDTLQWLEQRCRLNQEFVFINNRTETRFGERPSILGGLCEKAKVKYFSWYSLRHLAASYLASNNIPILDVSKYLGHSNTNTTQIYLHSLTEGAIKASNVLEKFFKT